MRKPDPRFMSRLMVSVAQEFDGSGEGRARCEANKSTLAWSGEGAEERAGTPTPGVLG